MVEMDGVVSLRYVVVHVASAGGHSWFWMFPADEPVLGDWRVVAEGSHDACVAALHLIDRPPDWTVQRPMSVPRRKEEA